MFAVYTKKDQLTSKLIWATALIMITLGALILLLGSGTSKAFGGAFVDDGFARYAKVVILWSSAITLIISRDYLSKNNLMELKSNYLTSTNSTSTIKFEFGGITPPAP